MNSEDPAPSNDLDPYSVLHPSQLPKDPPAAAEKPRAPRVFGRWGWTTWLPFLVFYLGVSTAVYIDNVRLKAQKGHEPGHEETHFGKVEKDKSAEATSPEPKPQESKHWFFALFPWEQTWYPMVYAITIGLTLVAMIMAIPGYRIPEFRISGTAIALGVVGVIVWVGLTTLDRDYIGLGAKFSKLGEREAFNPFEALKHNSTWMYSFIGIRLLGIALVVPIVEEFFLRGFLIRYLDDPDWDEIPLGVTITPIGFWGALAYGPFTHPGEVLAAAVWFGMVQWYYLRHKNIWDCVVIHAVTNLLLGLYILKFGAWELW